jgi:hypothetical protein
MQALDGDDLRALPLAHAQNQIRPAAGAGAVLGRRTKGGSPRRVVRSTHALSGGDNPFDFRYCRLSAMLS